MLLAVKMFFEMFQPRIDNLLHAEHFAAKDLFDVVDVPVRVRKPDVDGPREIVQALIIDQDADKHGKSGKGGRGKSRYQLIRSNHFSIKDIGPGTPAQPAAGIDC
jgi:hypothetical protein